MKTIWKITLDPEDIQELTMPEGAKILTVQVQDGKPQMWFLCEERAVKEKRTIWIIGTGHPIGMDFKVVYIGTYQLMKGALVFHVFDVTEN